MLRTSIVAMCLWACGPGLPGRIDETSRVSTRNEALPLEPMREERVATTLRVRYPDADIAVRGSVSPLSWDTDFLGERDGDDVVFRFEAPSGAAFEWKPVIRGGDAPLWSQGMNYRAEAGGEARVTPHFRAERGRVTTLFPKFHSLLLDNERDVLVYLPPSYDENRAATYPLLIMHDGQNLFDAATAFGGNEWRVDETLDQGIREGWLPELVVLGVCNTSARLDEYTPTHDPAYGFGGRGTAYLRFLTEELLPRAHAELRVERDRARTGIMGSSLGGLISVFAGKEQGGVFGLIGAMSPSSWWHDRYIIGAVSEGLPLPPTRVYLDSGDSGPSQDNMENTRALAAAFTSLGYEPGVTLEHIVQAGASHNEVYWAERLGHALWFLFQRE